MIIKKSNSISVLPVEMPYSLEIQTSDYYSFDDVALQDKDLIFHRDQLNPYCIIDLNKRIKFFNEAFKKILQYNNADFNHIHFHDIVLTKYHTTINDFITRSLLKEGKTPIFECEYITKTGKIIFVEQALFLIRNKLNNTFSIYVSIKEITLRKRFEVKIKKLRKDIQREKEKLEEALNIDKKMSNIFELNHLIDFIVNKTTQILNARRCSLMIYDDKNKELLIKGAKGLLPEIIKNTRVSLGSQICGIVAKRKRAVLVEDIEDDKRFHQRNKKDYTNKSFMIAPIVAHNKLLGIVNISEKIKKNNGDNVFNEFDLKIFSTIINQAGIMIESAINYRQLEYLSTIDSLANTYNHRYFIKQLNFEIKRANRYHIPLTIIMIDIDNFMEYNNLYGRHEGDNLIKKIGKILKDNSREIDVVCRYAGDEFVVILPQTDISKAQFVACKILNFVKKIKTKNPVSISIGIAGYSIGAKSSDLILKVYQAVHDAKGQPEKKVCCLA